MSRDRQGLFHWHCQGPPLQVYIVDRDFPKQYLTHLVVPGHSAVPEDETQETERFYFQLVIHIVIVYYTGLLMMDFPSSLCRNDN